ncbi:MAG TPA: formate dehydrogenase [Usitatibacter sp.]|nr:formate dehydrogenase [Usitatibacter sp.]
MKTTKTNRRRFLMAASLGSAGAVAAVVAAKRTTDAPGKDAAAAEPQQSGYRVTAHIEKYYKTTEV